MKEAVKSLCEHLQMIPQKDIQQNCQEFYDNVVRFLMYIFGGY